MQELPGATAAQGSAAAPAEGRRGPREASSSAGSLLQQPVAASPIGTGAAQPELPAAAGTSICLDAGAGTAGDAPAPRQQDPVADGLAGTSFLSALRSAQGPDMSNETLAAPAHASMAAGPQRPAPHKGTSARARAVSALREAGCKNPSPPQQLSAQTRARGGQLSVHDRSAAGVGKPSRSTEGHLGRRSALQCQVTHAGAVL